MDYDLCVYFRTGNPKCLTEIGSGELEIIVCGRVPWLYQYWPGGFMLFVVLLEAQPAVVLVLKRLRRRGKWLEVSPDRLFVAFPWVETSTGPGGFMICVFII